MNKQEFEEQLKIYDIAYDAGQPLIEDFEYEALVEQYIQQFDTKYIKPITSKLLSQPLPIYAPSLDKKKTLTDVEKFNNLSTSPKIVADKIDGFSMICEYTRDGRLNIFTHSNETYGSNISHLLKYIDIPKDLITRHDLKEYEKIIVRGEIAITLKNFEKHKDNYINPRNIISVVNAKNPNLEALVDFTFVAFQLIVYDTSNNIIPLILSKQFEELKTMGFTVVRHWQVDNLSYDALYNELKNNPCDYLRDGLVLAHDVFEMSISSEPVFKMAFKIEGELVQTTVTKVEWRESSGQLLIPRIHYKSVFTGGANLCHTTGFNAKYIVDNKIGVGTKILMTRRGSTIPYLSKVVEGTQADMPTVPFEWNKTKTNIVIQVNDNVKIKRIYRFFETLQVKFLGLKTVEKLYHSGLNTVNAIITATVDDLMKVDGIKKAGATRSVKQIEDGMKRVDMCKVMDGSCVFNGFGESKITAILISLPVIYDMMLYDKNNDKNKDKNRDEDKNGDEEGNNENVNDEEKDISIDDLQNVPGIKELAHVFLANLPIFKVFLNDIPTVKNILVKQHERKSNTTSILSTLTPIDTDAQLDNDNDKNNNEDNIITPLINIITPPLVAPDESKMVLKGMYIVFSGDKKLTNKAKDLGAVVDKSVKKQTTLLVVDQVGTLNSKERVCREKGIPIMSLNDFKIKYKL